jgi:uncharacterized protein with von Willebrand factor type A (vWA) domain
MIECIAIGDSIAVGVGQAAHCKINAKVGASSSYVADHTISSNKSVAVISAGSNDPHNPRLRTNLDRIRSKITAKRVIWILPYNRKAAAVVQAAAVQYGDGYIDLAAFKTRDGVHPSSYGSVARKL